MKIFCIIPAFNEAKTISRVIRGVKPLVDAIVVVDDASSDDTCRLAKNAGAIVLRHIINRDQGAALRTGNDYALAHGADIIIHFDADGQHQTKDIKAVIKPIIDKEVDVVLGSRFLRDQPSMPWLKKYMWFPLARVINKVLLNVNYTDPQSGLRAMTRRAVERVAIEQDGKAHCSEILYKLQKYKIKVIEVPITVIYHDFGLKFGDGLRIVKDILIYKLLN